MHYTELEVRKDLWGKLGVKQAGLAVEVGKQLVIEEGLDDATSDGFQVIAVYLGIHSFRVEHLLGDQVIATQSVEGPKFNNYPPLRGRLRLSR